MKNHREEVSLGQRKTNVSTGVERERLVCPQVWTMACLKAKPPPLSKSGKTIIWGFLILLVFQVSTRGQGFHLSFLVLLCISLGICMGYEFASAYTYIMEGMNQAS